MRALSRWTASILMAISLMTLDVIVLPAVPALACADDIVLYCQPTDGVIHDGSGNGVLPQVPGDPSPNAPGIWLGHRVSRQACYADYNRFVTDVDKDWLDDECEVQLARAFAPALAMSPTDDCAEGEPYWSAKYFPDSTAGWGNFVRIAYMPGYYRDCGMFGHAGDSEFIMIGIQFDVSTGHWIMREAYLSAHASQATDSSEYVRIPGNMEFPTRQLAYPRIWIARSKHANYRYQARCDAGAVYFDTCDDNITVGRMRVYRDRNTGSRFVDRFATGTISANPLYQNSGRREFFYKQATFGGWQPAAIGVTPYRNFLMSYFYECFDYKYGFDGYNCFWGQGPNPPTYFYLTGTIEGQNAVHKGASGTWTTYVTGGQLPYTAKWWRRYASDTEATLIGTSTGSGAFSAGTLTYTPDRCEQFTLTMKVTSANGQYSYDDHTVSMVCPISPPPLNVYIAGPGSIETKGNYAFTAVTSGATSPSFTWAERFCDDQQGASCSAWAEVTGLGETFSRTLNPDCSGTGQKTFWLRIIVTNNDGRTAESEHYSSLCGPA